MIFGIGIDTIEVPRIARSIAVYGDQFLKRIYCEEEIRYSIDRPHAAEHFAARFAAKEAYAKALGTGVRRGFIWNQTCVLKEWSGRPYIELRGKMIERARHIIGSEFVIKLSITHTKEIAEAMVTIEVNGA
jgi:holo-[acyl-carrier protein] synthase